MKKIMSGQITVFASLIIVLIMSVIGASIQSASMSITKTNANMACNLAVEGCFAQYNSTLLDEFNILLLEKNDQLESMLSSIIEENLKYPSYLVSNKLQSLKIDNVISATDNGGVIKQEVLDYMKYGIVSEVANYMIDNKNAEEKSKKTKEVVDKISICQNDIREIDKIIASLITDIEGIQTNAYGLSIKNNIPQIVQGDFVKMLCLGPISQENVSVSNSLIYNVLSDRYINVQELLTDMHISSEEIYKDDLSQYDIDHYKSVYTDLYNCFVSAVSKVKKKMQDSIQVAEKYDNSLDKVNQKIEKVEEDIESYGELLGNELKCGFKEDLSEIKNYGGEDSVSICNVPILLTALKNNSSVIDNVESILEDMGRDLNKENAKQIMILIEKCMDCLSQYDNKHLSFDYSHINFSSSPEGLGKIENILDTINNGILNLVIEDSSKVSKKEISYQDLASSMKNQKKYNSTMNETLNPKENVTYNEYLVSKFPCYVDNFDDNGNHISSDNPLEYSLEYIIGKQNNDPDNLKKVILELSFIREGVNLSYLFTDQEKKLESYSLALGLLGFTGMPALVKAGQYLIMTAWAYGETIMDLKNLLSGNKIPTIKSKSNWQLSLEKLLNLNFTIEDSKGLGVEENKKGLSYKDYLRILLFMEEPEDKYYGTMDMMELVMITKGYKDFRMKNYIYRMEASALFYLNKGKITYTQEMHYQY